jgi:hypothetical protein
MNNIDKEKLIDEIVASSGGKLEREKLKGVANKKDISALMGSLSDEDKKKLSAALSDKNALAQMLKSEQARSILNAFLKDGRKNG